MSGTKTVHQCLFCPQTFDSAPEKDDHILEHFAQETCADCDQHLIRIGSNLYTLHNAVTCIKRELKSEVCILPENRNENCNKNHHNEDIIAPSNNVCDQAIDIKLEPETQDEEFTCIDEMNLKENSGIDNDTNQLLQSQSRAALPNVSIKRKPIVTRAACDICGQFFHKCALKRHKILKHSNKSLEKKAAKNLKLFECTICKKVVQTRLYLRRHMKIKHDSNCVTFKCGFCYSILMSKRSLDYHVANCKRRRKKSTKKPSNEGTETNIANYYQSKEIPTTVDETKVQGTFHTSNAVAGNQVEIKLESQNQVEPFISPEMDNLKKTSNKDSNISQSIAPRAPFICIHCGRHYLSQNPLDNHLLSCNGKRLICEICSKTFMTRKNLQKHTFEVHKVGGYHCPICKAALVTAEGLAKHGPRCKMLSMRKFECCFCHTTIKSKRSVRTHILSAHVLNDKTNACELCGKNFLYKSQCEKHKNSVHLNLKSSEAQNFVCSTCGRAFSRGQSLRQHENIHSGAKPFKCSYEGCDRSFCNPTTRRVHQKSHLGLKRYQCQIEGCPEQFGGRVAYKKHKLNAHGIPMTKK